MRECQPLSCVQEPPEMVREWPVKQSTSPALLSAPPSTI
jgi:hypothetical protein